MLSRDHCHKLPPSNCFCETQSKTEYPSLYERLIWNYKNANEQLINRAIESFNWEKAFEGENVHDQVYCVCVKRITLCNCLCSSCSHDFANVIRNIGECGAKNYFTDHRTANAIHGFRAAVLVL